MKKLHLVKPDAAPRGDSSYVFANIPCGQLRVCEASFILSSIHQSFVGFNNITDGGPNKIMTDRFRALSVTSSGGMGESSLTETSKF